MGSVRGSNGGSGGTFVYRGNSGGEDFDAADLTADAAFHTLDLSAIVPAGAKAVLLGVLLDPASTSNAVLSFLHGDSTDTVSDIRIVARSGASDGGAIIVPLNDSREIQYSASNVSYDLIRITIHGWWT